jgi:hypothetical protein
VDSEPSEEKACPPPDNIDEGKVFDGKPTSYHISDIENELRPNR